jgi:hypothetical protein
MYKGELPRNYGRSRVPSKSGNVHPEQPGIGTHATSGSIHNICALRAFSVCNDDLVSTSLVYTRSTRSSMLF